MMPYNHPYTQIDAGTAPKAAAPSVPFTLTRAQSVAALSSRTPMQSRVNSMHFTDYDSDEEEEGAPPKHVSRMSESDRALQDEQLFTPGAMKPNYRLKKLMTEGDSPLLTRPAWLAPIDKVEPLRTRRKENVDKIPSEEGNGDFYEPSLAVPLTRTIPPKKLNKLKKSMSLMFPSSGHSSDTSSLSSVSIIDTPRLVLRRAPRKSLTKKLSLRFLRDMGAGTKAEAVIIPPAPALPLHLTPEEHPRLRRSSTAMGMYRFEVERAPPALFSVPLPEHLEEEEVEAIRREVLHTNRMLNEQFEVVPVVAPKKFEPRPEFQLF